jgi:hypothetical protein
VPRAPEPLLSRLSQGFWKVWEKTWVLIFVVFVGFNLLAAYRWGWPTLVQAWGAMFAIIGLGTLFSYQRGISRARESMMLAPAEARILCSKVREERQGSSSMHDGSPMTCYYPEVEYEYDFQGMTYTSNKILFLTVNYSSTEAEGTVARYPAGARVTAYVDSANPRLAVLEPGLEGKRGKYAIAAIVGAAFVIMGVATWFLVPVLVRTFAR